MRKLSPDVADEAGKLKLEHQEASNFATMLVAHKALQWHANAADQEQGIGATCR